jgi:hypothetical protein
MTNFGQMVEEIRAVVEKDVFVPADQKELDKRRSDYEEIQRKEEERIRKEREEEIKALGLSPQYKKIMALIPAVQDLWGEYTDDLADWIGNYSVMNDWDVPIQISFNIKIYGGNVPDWAQKRLDEEGLVEASNEHYWQYLLDQLEAFAEGLTEDYDFIETWHVEGRMGGWLVLKVGAIQPDDMDAVIEVFSTNPADDEDWFTRRGMQDAYNILKNIKKDLETRVNGYQEIADKVEKAKKYVEKYAESDEYWKEFFLSYGEEEEKPAKKKK